MAGRLVRPRDHDHRQAEHARRLDLGVGRAAAGVLRDHDVDLLARSAGAARRRDRTVRAACSRTRSGGQSRLAAARSAARCSGAAALRRRSAVPAGRDSGRRGAAPCRAHRAAATASGRPASDRRPRACQAGRTSEASGTPVSRAGRDGVGGNLVGVGMRGVDHRVDRLARAGSRARPSAPPKPPTRVAIGCGLRVGGAAGQRQDRREARIAGEHARPAPRLPSCRRG